MPPLGSNRVQSILMVVVLTAPFGPSRPKISPALMSKLTPLTATWYSGGERSIEVNLPHHDRDLFAFRSDNDLAQMAAVRSGLGIGAIQNQLARRWGLTPILSNAFNFELEVWIAMHENLKSNRRMRLMFDHLVTGLQAFVAEGRKV